MAVTRARQTPEQRRRMALVARQAQRKDEIARLLARVYLLANTERGRILMAYSMGRDAAKVRRYRRRQITKGRAA